MKQNVKKVFTEAQEEKLVTYAIQVAKMFYGLPRTEFRRLAYDFAKACQSPAIPANWDDEQRASTDWYYGFMNRHPELALKAPEGMSIARATAFNRTSVKAFFDLYTSAMEKYSFPPDRIYNLDETSLSTVMKPVKVVCEKGQPVASQISRERGVTMTFLGIINAAGHFIPPVFIIPRKRWNDAFMRGTLDGSKGLLQSTGWMNGECFLETLKHIKEKTFCSPTNKILIIMDNAECHKSIYAIEYAQNNGICIVTLPPHTTDKMQPLDVSVYSSFKSCMRNIIHNYTLMNPHTHISEHMLPEFASKAWVTACTPNNVLKGFASTGIWPINTDIFTDDAFLGAEVSERPPPSAEEAAVALDEGVGSLVDSGVDSGLLVVSPGSSDTVVSPGPSSSGTLVGSPGPSSYCGPSTPSTSRSVEEVTPESVRPFPKAATRPSARGRKRFRACILTEDEEAISALREKEEKKRRKQEKAPARRGRPRSRQREEVGRDSEEEEAAAIQERVPLDDSSEYSEEEVGVEVEAPSLFLEREAAVGDFVLVELELEEGRNAGDKVHYVAKVLSVSEDRGEGGSGEVGSSQVVGSSEVVGSGGEIEVSYLRKSGKYGIDDTFFFPIIEDTGHVGRDKVLGVLCEPLKGQTKRLSKIVKFPMQFVGYNLH